MPKNLDSFSLPDNVIEIMKIDKGSIKNDKV